MMARNQLLQTIAAGAWALVSLAGPVRAETPSAIDLLFDGTDPAGAIRSARVERGWSNRVCATATWTLEGTDPADRLAPFEIVVRTAVPQSFSAATPTVLLLPPTGGGTLLDERLIQILCEEGVRAFLVREWSGHLETDLDPATHDRGSLRGVAAVRQTLTHFGIERAGIYGTSLGGIIASIAAGVDERITAAVLTVAGGNVIETLARSDQELLVDLRARRMKEYGLCSLDDYEAFLRRAITINASEFTRPELRNSTWMLVATQDTTVPSHLQDELWERWGRPLRTDFKLSHIPTVIWVELTYARNIARFFRAKLDN